MDAHHLVATEPNPKIQDFRPGDTVRVSIKVREGDRQRIQVFEGVVIRKRGGGAGTTFTVRRVARTRQRHRLIFPHQDHFLSTKSFS